jgi:predicted nucleic acid-binding protein
MGSIVIDSNVIISFLDTQDTKHVPAVVLSKHIQSEYNTLLILNIVLYEVLTVLSMKGNKEKALAFYNELKHDLSVRIVFMDDALEVIALRIFRGATSKNMSFADCALIALAQNEHVHAIASFDAHIKRNSKSIPVIS